MYLLFGLRIINAANSKMWSAYALNLCPSLETVSFCIL